MKYLHIILILVLTTTYSQVKKDKPPIFPPKYHGKIRKHKRDVNVLQLTQLKQNSDSLYCWKINYKCNILDGVTFIYTHCNATQGDDASIIICLYSKGEFLKGKFQGKWLFYGNNGKITKEEKWEKGVLISTIKY
jgi:hypothetical protein